MKRYTTILISTFLALLLISCESTEEGNLTIHIGDSSSHRAAATPEDVNFVHIAVFNTSSIDSISEETLLQKVTLSSSETSASFTVNSGPIAVVIWSQDPDNMANYYGSAIGTVAPGSTTDLSISMKRFYTTFNLNKTEAASMANFTWTPIPGATSYTLDGQGDGVSGTLYTGAIPTYSTAANLIAGYLDFSISATSTIFDLTSASGNYGGGGDQVIPQ